MSALRGDDFADLQRNCCSGCEMKEATHKTLGREHRAVAIDVFAFGFCCLAVGCCEVSRRGGNIRFAPKEFRIWDCRGVINIIEYLAVRWSCQLLPVSGHKISYG